MVIFCEKTPKILIFRNRTSNFCRIKAKFVMQLTLYDKMVLIFVVAKTYFALKITNYEQFNYFLVIFSAELLTLIHGSK